MNANGFIFSREWAMPTADTFDCPPIEGFVKKYLMRSKVSVDAFSRNRRWFTYTNDINPNTAADNHDDAEVFLKRLQSRSITCDLFIFDPPYSPRQLKECYNGFGRKMQLEDGQTARLRKIWKSAGAPLIGDGGVALSFGWNSVGFGTELGFEIIEILLVCHGADHNDTICVAERRVSPHPELPLS